MAETENKKPMLGPMAIVAVPQNKACLVAAEYLSAATIRVSFADGNSFTLVIGDLELPTDKLRWETASAASTGEEMLVEASDGDVIPIDSASIRSLVDPEYARELERAFLKLRGPLAGLERSVRLGHPRCSEESESDSPF
jgi:hypothetical protein